MTDHPIKGTCNDTSCPLHGMCHCGCGRATKPWRFSTQPGRGYRRGLPGIFCCGHNTNRGIAAAGVERRRAAEIARLLVRHTGSINAAAIAAGVSWGAIRQLLDGQGHASPRVVKAVVDEVLAIRNGKRRRLKITARWDHREPMLPASPVMEQLELDFNSHHQLELELGDAFGVAPRSVARWLAKMRETDQVPLSLADGLATALGRHPVEIWGPVWDELAEVA